MEVEGLSRRLLCAGEFGLLGGALGDAEGGLAMLALDQLAADLFRDGEDLAAGEARGDDLNGHKRSGVIIGWKGEGLEDCELWRRRSALLEHSSAIQNPQSTIQNGAPL